MRIQLALAFVMALSPVAVLAQLPGLPSGTPNLPLGMVRGQGRTAQEQPAATRESVTEVAPLISTPLAPIPKVGAGATYFSVEELHGTAVQARKDDIDVRAGVHLCRDASINPDMVELEMDGKIDMQTLLATEAAAQARLQHAAEEAEVATKAAMDARRGLILGATLQRDVDSAELQRQTTIREYQAALGGVSEAQARIADLQDLVELVFTGDPGRVKLANNADWVRASGIDIELNFRSHIRQQGDSQAGVYVPFEFRDLRLSEVVSRERKEGDQTVLRVSGKIHNPRKISVAVPPIWVSAVDQFGTGLKSEQAEAPRGQKAIKAGGSLSFTYAMKPMPEKASRAVVTFAPLHHPPRYKPVQAYCAGG